MATPSGLIGTVEPIRTAPPTSTEIASVPAKAQPLWRFALTGLGPLAALGLLALVIAFLQRAA